MGLQPTRANENDPRRHPRESGGPFSVRNTMDSRLRGNDTEGVIFRRAAGDEESRSAVKKDRSEIPRGVYPEHPERDSFTSFRTGSSLRSG
jgi:hypothetical protein